MNKFAKPGNMISVSNFSLELLMCTFSIKMYCVCNAA